MPEKKKKTKKEAKVRQRDLKPRKEVKAGSIAYHPGGRLGTSKT